VLYHVSCAATVFLIAFPPFLPPSLPAGAGPVDDHGRGRVQRLQARHWALKREGGRDGGTEGGTEGFKYVCMRGFGDG